MIASSGVVEDFGDIDFVHGAVPERQPQPAMCERLDMGPSSPPARSID